ncbi:hypothetical protein diail_10906 [Diaporthe ilicicola]|nr:hypothetical protein diail_10906 [Diaporthe ilicicola]
MVKGKRERKAINALLFPDASAQDLDKFAKDNIDTLPPSEKDILAAALGASARQVIIRAEEVGPKSGWRDGFLTAEYGFVPPDSLQSSRIPGCVARGRVRDSIAALPVVEATEDIPDTALWAALVGLGMLCSICWYEDKHDGHDGVSLRSSSKPKCELSDDVIEEVKGLPRSIGLPYFQSSYNVKIRDHNSTRPYVARFDNMNMRWPMFGDQAEMVFLKGVADTSASFQHGPDAIAAAFESYENDGALTRMRSFTDHNMRSIRRLSKMPAVMENLSNAMGGGGQQHGGLNGLGIAGIMASRLP